jgi:hypothetical protein
MTLLALLACSDYNLRGREDVTDPLGDSSWDEACDKLATPGGDVEITDECFLEPIIGTWTPQMEWTSTAPGDTYTTPVIGQLDADEQSEVVVANVSGVIYVLDGLDGSVQWSGGSLGAEPMTAAIGDLDGDGRAEVVGSGVGGTYAFRGDGTLLWSVGTQPSGNTSQCGAVGIADLEGDGKPEVILGSLILDGMDGSVKGSGAYGSGAGHQWAAPMGYAADIDQDGTMEVVVGNALYRADGSTIWYNGQSDGFVAVADFDPDEYGEIVVAREGTLRLQDHDGTVLWTRSGLTGGTIGPPTVADFDNDGKPEIGVAGSGMYVVVDGEDGSIIWRRDTKDFSSGFTGSAVFDFEGDGGAEVVYADEDNVWVFDGRNGETKLQESRHSSATCSEYPAIADVDNDGHAEIIYSSGVYSGSETGVSVIGDAEDSWQSSRPVWNQHAYSVTNVNEDSTIPTEVEPNWWTYNTFRSGDVLAGNQGELPDLFVEMEVCELNCDEGEIVVWAQVGNRGVSEVDRLFPVSLFAVTADGHVLIDEVIVGDPVPSGRSLDAIELRGSVEGLEVAALVVKVDGGDDSAGTVGECDEENDQVVHAQAVCD